MTSSYSLSDAQVAFETYGANFDRWPDQALAAFAKDHRKLQSVRREAEHLDAHLSAHNVPDVSDLIKGRIVKLAAQTPQDAIVPTVAAEQNNEAPLATSRNWMRIAALFLVSAIIGSAFYMQSPTETTHEPLTASLDIDAETDAWLVAANEMDLVDVFLWVETDSVEG